MAQQAIPSPTSAQVASGSEPKQDESLDDVDVTQLVFPDDEDEAQTMHRRAPSMASTSSAAVDEEVSRSSSLTGRV